MMADMQTKKYFNLVGDEDDIGSEHFKWNHGVLAHSAIIGIPLALPLHTFQPYSLICRFMAPRTPWVPLLFAPGRRLIVSFAALLTSLILVNRETLVQARLSVASCPWRHYQWSWCRRSRGGWQSFAGF